jgi:hypothetical protein
VTGVTLSVSEPTSPGRFAHVTQPRRFPIFAHATRSLPRWPVLLVLDEDFDRAKTSSVKDAEVE